MEVHTVFVRLPLPHDREFLNTCKQSRSFKTCLNADRCWGDVRLSASSGEARNTATNCAQSESHEYLRYIKSSTFWPQMKQGLANLLRSNGKKQPCCSSLRFYMYVVCEISGDGRASSSGNVSIAK